MAHPYKIYTQERYFLPVLKNWVCMPSNRMKQWFIFLYVQCFFSLPILCFGDHGMPTGLPLYYWQQKSFVNFGDYLSLKIVERIVKSPVQVYKKNFHHPQKKLLAIGSILSFATEGDVIWGTGINGKLLNKTDYRFKHLDVRAVRGPLTRQFLFENFQIECPEIYGDPALLFPYLFPEFKKNENPSIDYLIIPHYSDISMLSYYKNVHVVLPTEPWEVVVQKILDSKFVISSSLHGIILAEAYGIPARLIRLSDAEPLFKYIDYYLGTNRTHFRFATSVPEARILGGEEPPTCDLEKLYHSFPFEFWSNREVNPLIFGE